MIDSSARRRQLLESRGVLHEHLALGRGTRAPWRRLASPARSSEPGTARSVSPQPGPSGEHDSARRRSIRPAARDLARERALLRLVHRLGQHLDPRPRVESTIRVIARRDASLIRRCPRGDFSRRRRQHARLPRSSVHLPVAGDKGGPPRGSRQRHHAGQLPALYQLERGATAGFGIEVVNRSHARPRCRNAIWHAPETVDAQTAVHHRTSPREFDRTPCYREPERAAASSDLAHQRSRARTRSCSQSRLAPIRTSMQACSRCDTITLKPGLVPGERPARRRRVRERPRGRRSAWQCRFGAPGALEILLRERPLGARYRSGAPVPMLPNTIAAVGRGR